MAVGVALLAVVPVACRNRGDVNQPTGDRSPALGDASHRGATSNPDPSIDTTAADDAASSVGGRTSSQPDAEFPETPNPFAGNTGNDPVIVDQPPSNTAMLRFRDATLQSRIEWFNRDNIEPRWPLGVYAFRLRHPEPPNPSTDSRWEKIVNANVYHRRQLYAKAEEALIDAMAGTDDGDTRMIAFNLGAARQMMHLLKIKSDRNPDADMHGNAIAAFRHALSEPATRIVGDADWSRANFRHYAARALSVLLMEINARTEAVEFARQAAFVHPMMDFNTQEKLPEAISAERLLPAIYAYVERDILDESPEALQLLLDEARPVISGDNVAQILARFFESCLDRMKHQAVVEALPAHRPQCFEREFLKELLHRFMDDFPGHPRRDELMRRAQAAGL